MKLKLPLYAAVSLLAFMLTGAAQALTFDHTQLAIAEERIGVFGQNLSSISTTPLDLTITNDTGVTWTDYHLVLGGLGGMIAGSYSGLGTAVESSAWTIPPSVGVFSQLDIFDISIDDGESLVFSVNHYCAGEVCSAGFVPITLDGTPTIDGEGPGPAIPEPSAALVFSIGVLVIGSRARRQS